MKIKLNIKPVSFTGSTKDHAIDTAIKSLNLMITDNGMCYNTNNELVLMNFSKIRAKQIQEQTATGVKMFNGNEVKFKQTLASSKGYWQANCYTIPKGINDNHGVSFVQFEDGFIIESN